MPVPSEGRSSFSPCGLVTLTTDFGTTDGYVGAMKGRILACSRELRVEDIAHGIPAQNIVHGAATICAAAPYWPPGTVHIVVIDPDVGTERRALAAVAGGHCLVGPDNGVLAPVLERLGTEACHQITRNRATESFLPDVTAPTFHGRDLFAPIGAALASGALSLPETGPSCDWLRPEQPRAVPGVDHVEGEIILFDHFGNGVTNLRAEDLPGPAPLTVSCGGISLALLNTYAAVAPGKALALMGSSGFLEIAVRDKHAGERLGLRLHDRIQVRKA